MPTLSQLVYIVAVERLRHFGRAAEACHVSQPSLSMQIQKVEEEMGLIIFDRLKKPVVPTEKGKLFVEQAKVILRESDKLASLVKKTGSEVSGDFRLGVIPTLSPYLLPIFIESFATAYPKVQLKIDELKTETIVRELQEDNLDAAILATPLHVDGLKEKVLFYEKFSLFVGKKHRLSDRKRIKEEELDGSDMWLLQDGHCLRNQLVRICSVNEGSRVFPNVMFEGGNLETLRFLIKKGPGCTLVPQLFVNALPESERRDLVKEFEHPAPYREVSLVFRRDQWKSDILSAIEGTIQGNLTKDFKHSLDKAKAHVVEIKPNS